MAGMQGVSKGVLTAADSFGLATTLQYFHENGWYALAYSLIGFNGSSRVQKIKYRLGVPVTSQILTGDSQKLSFSTLTKVPFLIF